MAEAKSLGIEVLPPNINHSGVNFTVDNGKILFGLGSVASVGASSKEIVEERKKRKYEDFSISLRGLMFLKMQWKT